MLAQRMRASNWVNAQVQLVGKVECETPDPVTVLNILGVYEVNNRDMRAARAALTPAQREKVLAYLLRHDQLVERENKDKDGRVSRYWAPVPPAMQDDEREAFAALWRRLSRMGALRRLTPRPKPKPESAPAAE